MNRTLQDFLKFEVNEKLFQHKYKGVYYWQTMRFQIAETVNKISVHPIYTKKEKNKKWFGEKLHIFRNAIYDIRNWRKLKKADILYFDQCSYRNIGRKKVDPYFGYFGFEKEYSIQRCFYLDRDDGKEYMGKGVGTAIAELKSYFIIRFSKMFPFLFDDNKEKEFIYGLCKRINSKFKTEIIPSQVIYRAKKASIIYHIYYKYYIKILKKIEPKVIFVVCHYSDNLWPLYPVAKNMGIPVIELEHGRINSHISYNYMDLSDLGKQLPDYLFTYGDFWNNDISLPMYMKVYSVGNPFLENRYNYYAGSEMDDKTIVIYSDRWEINGRRLMELAISISNKYYSEGYRVFFKLHPGEYKNWNEKYINYKNDTKVTVLTDEIELYKLLSMAKYQIGVGSTVLYEATVFDANIYILNPENEEMFEGVKPLLDFKRAYLIKDFKEFEQFMLLDGMQYKNIKDKIWKTNACRNAQEILKKILSLNH